MSSSVELNNEIEVQLLSKWAEAYEKKDVSIIHEDLADDFRLRSWTGFLYSENDLEEYWKISKVGQTLNSEDVSYKFEIMMKPKNVKHINISNYANIRDEEALETKCLCPSKYVLVQYISDNRDYCFFLCFNDSNKITKIEEYCCKARQLWFEF